MFQNDPNLATDEASILAMMAVIGGVDSRPRLGGVVKIDDAGIGTISKITPRGKILIQMSDGTVASSRLSALIPVSCYRSPRYKYRIHLHLYQ